MPTLVYHDMLEDEFHEDDSNSSGSEQDPPPEPDSDIEELKSEDFPTYFTQRGRRLFHSTDAPYPLPVDGREIQVRCLSWILVLSEMIH